MPRTTRRPLADRGRRQQLSSAPRATGQAMVRDARTLIGIRTDSDPASLRRETGEDLWRVYRMSADVSEPWRGQGRAM